MECVLFAKDMYKRNADSTVIYTIHVNPPRLIRFREYRRGFQTPHGLSSMPATLGRNGYLTTDTAQTQ